MRTRSIIIGIIGIIGLTGCGAELPTVQPGQSESLHSDRQLRPAEYVVSVLPWLGGTSRGNAINDRGWVAGYSNLPDGATRHAALWENGAVTDLGTLGGPNSNVPWPGLTINGIIAGISETEAVDPLAEDWSCAAFFPTATHHVCRGFVRSAGVMHELPPLGGTHSFASSVNIRGDVVGWSETTVHDPTCVAPQVRQFRATLWRTRTYDAIQLPPLPGDSASAATGINDLGQVIGISGDCGVAVGAFSARHAVLWDHGRVIDLGNFGGAAWNTPMAINFFGEVVGFSDLPGDDDGVSREHAFLWTRRGGMRDLGTLPGDITSEALGINARGQVVGTSCGAVSCRAFLWQDGEMISLADVTALAPGDVLSSAQDINDLGQITGRIVQASTGRRLAFIATPAGGKLKL